MKITIEFEVGDKAFVAGYAKATGWRDDGTMTAEDWMKKNVSEYVTARGKTGMALAVTQPERNDYLAAMRTAMSTVVVPVIETGIKTGTIVTP